MSICNIGLLGFKHEQEEFSISNFEFSISELAVQLDGGPKWQ